MEDNTKSVACGRLAFWPNMDLLSSERLLWLLPVETSPELLLAVREAVETELSARQREVVEGYFFQGLSQPELAVKLGIRQQVIHKCLYGSKRKGRMVGGALKKLQAVLAPLVTL
jgi:DNA-directed RNA polymerase specialized sigma24 family protein